MVGVRIWITEPIRTPLSLARVYEASTSSGFDWSGIRPESSLTVRRRPAGPISKTPNALRSIRFRQVSQRWTTFTGPGAGVTDLTSGRRDSDGSGRTL